MFAPTYFAPTYFPGDYFAPGAPVVVPDVPLKYFVPDYFASDYFAGTYFANGGVTIVAGYPDGLPEAIGRAVEAAGLTCWADAKPRGVANPALIVKIPTGVLWTSDDVADVYTLRPTLTVMASTKAEADSLGETVLDAIRGTTFAYGSGGEVKTYPMVLQGRKRSKDEVETINGERVFRDVTEWMIREIRPR